jgi:hypothetical protein
VTSEALLPFENSVEAYESVAEELAALEPHEVMRVNVDLPRAAQVVFATAPGISALLPEMEQRLLDVPRARILRLPTYALAAWHASASSWRIRRLSPTRPIAERAKPVRDHMLRSAEALARIGLLEMHRVQAARKGPGQLGLAQSMIALSALFRGEWPRIAATGFVDAREVERLSAVGQELIHALACGKHELRARRAAMADGPARAFTVLWRAYDAARRAVSYLRWEHGDAHLIAPALADHRSGKRRRRSAQSVEEVVSQTDEKSP